MKLENQFIDYNLSNLKGFKGVPVVDTSGAISNHLPIQNPQTFPVALFGLGYCLLTKNGFSGGEKVSLFGQPVQNKVTGCRSR